MRYINETLKFSVIEHTKRIRFMFQMGEELERMHPRIYSNVSRQLSRVAFGELQVRLNRLFSDIIYTVNARK